MPAGSNLRDGLIAEYRFSGDARDTSGAGRHGVVHGASLTTDRFGHPDSAYRFDGVDDWIEVDPPPSLSADALTVSAWFCAEARDVRGWTNCIVAQDDGNDEDQSRRVFQLSADCGRLVWHRMTNARDPMWQRRVVPGVWTHAVAVYQGGLHRLYVDGTLRDTEKDPLRVHPTQPLLIGRKGTPEPCFFFKGAVDEVMLWNRALTEPEVRELLHQDGWTPAPPNGLPVVGDPICGWWGQDGVVFLDLRYDGAARLTGRIMAGRPDNMSPIVTGTFDRSTGALRLAGEARDPKMGGPVTWIIEGVLDRDEIAVIARFNNYTGNFILSRPGTRLRGSWRSIRSHAGALGYKLWGRRTP